MSSIDDKELFEQYYQNEYDFNTTSLSLEEVEDIKKLAREKREAYGLAPMGTGVFDWILKQSRELRFEMIDFESDKIDGMLYIPNTEHGYAYIVLNENKPLINQIFTAAHEFYHFIRDYQIFKEKPYICNFNSLKAINEKCASRFAAELLLPEEALAREIKESVSSFGVDSVEKLGFSEYASLSLVLTIKYQIPLKAVIYRLAEEGYIKSVDEYIDNYQFMKRVLQKIRIYEKQVQELYGNENNYVVPYSSTYQDMESSFLAGNATKESILKDAETLHLDMQLVNDFLTEDDEEEVDDSDDDALFSIINGKWG